MKKILALLILNLLCLTPVYAVSQSVDLVVSYKIVNFAGKSVQALAINDQIPGPTLHFKEGDRVIINVYNHLDKNTSIHWHGLLVPWQMDGVEGITQAPIPPGGVFHYEFTLKQAGTYWYHAHSGLEEQEGLYGALIIDPRNSPSYHYNKDYPIVLSDWSNTQADQIYANLKKDGDYYSSQFPLQPSLMKFMHDYKNATPEEKKNILDDYKMMQQMRMSIYDYNDIAYDAFLFNGHTCKNPWAALVKVGDTVRLRFIGAGGSTIFHVKVPHTTMQVIHVEGNDVKPYDIKDLTIAPGETYDVLVKIQKNSPYIIYAESSDSSGAAIGALITEPNQKINLSTISPFPTPQPVTREMMMPGMSMMDMANMPDMNMGTKYDNLVSPVKTNDPNKPVEVIKMVLSGYMGRNMWFINGLSEHNAKPILIQPGKRYRIVFTNNSMMHHPMHIHGHFFILRNGHGAYDPLLHTIDVAPGETVTADFDADTNGQWLFHCHLLYHMMSGMARVFQYPDMVSQTHLMAHPQHLYSATYLDIGADPFSNIGKMTFKFLYGSDENKLELYSEEAQIKKDVVQNADLDIFYWHLISEFWAIKSGANYVYRPAQTPYWQPGLGIEGLMPYFINTDFRTYYHDGSQKFDLQLSRDTQISDKFFVRMGIRSIFATQTITSDEIGSGLNQIQYTLRPYYQLTPGVAIFTEFEHESDYGPLSNILRHENEPSTQNSITFGISLLF